MHSAPSVSYPVGRSALEALALALLGVVGGGAVLWGWWVARGAAPAQSGWSLGPLGMVLWVVWMLAAARHWWRQPTGLLKWDAQATPAQLDCPPGGWFWCAQENGLKPVAVHPERVFDGQGWLLLSLRGPWRMGMWVWLERKADPRRWDDVRRALVHAR